MKKVSFNPRFKPAMKSSQYSTKTKHVTVKMQHVEPLSTPSKRLLRFQPSNRFSERKRALFPSQDTESDSDLGHMSPLELSSSPERYDTGVHLVEKIKDIDHRYFNVFENGSQPVKIVSHKVPSLFETVEKVAISEELHDKENVNRSLFNKTDDEHSSPNSANENTVIPKKWSALFQDKHNENTSPNKLQPNVTDVHTNRRIITKKLSGLFQDISQDAQTKSPKNGRELRHSPSPEILAPNTPSTSGSPSKENNNTFIPETPVKSSPTQNLKTPHDNTNTNLQLPRLVRKSLLDLSNIDKSNLKRKSDSPIEKSCKHPKLDTSFNKVSKARTALFTENIFPAKSFYPKSDANKLEINFRLDSTVKSKISPRRPAPIYLCSRSRGKNKKKYFGQINAGVRHGIKKPKHKPALTKTQLLKAALSIVKNSPLNEFLDKKNEEETLEMNECGVSLEQIQKMDSILKNIDTRTIQPQPMTNVSVSSQTVINKQTPVEQTFGIKRPLSPQQDTNKKFFKSGPSRATVTISQNIKLNFDHGEFSLVEKRHRIYKPKSVYVELDMPDFSINEDEKIVDNSFSDILKSLEDDNICEPKIPAAIVHSVSDSAVQSDLSPTNFTLTAHSSVIASENSIQLHTAPRNGEPMKPKVSNDILLSPTSLVCDMTSGLALDSPKSQTVQNIDLNKLSETKKRICFSETMADESGKKLFPIFYGNQNEAAKQSPKESRHVKNIRKIWKPLSEDQTLIDAGQKRFGVTQCAECKVVYSLGEPEDEIMHYQYHNSIRVLRYNGWKHERVVNQFQQGKVIQINPNDPKSWWRKVKEILENVVNRDLGFVDVPFETTNTKVFLCIMNKQIVGCLVAEPKTKAHKMLPSTNGVDHCSEESYPVKCGVSRLWVAVTHRKRGIATNLMNCMRSQFMYGHILSVAEIAFSSPTDSGKTFACKYTKTESFLIYTS